MCQLWKGKERPESGCLSKAESTGFPDSLDVGCKRKGQNRDSFEDAPEQALGRRGLYPDGRKPREGQAGEGGQSAMPTRYPRRDVWSAHGHGHLEDRAEVSAGNIHLESVSNGKAFKVTGQDKLNCRMMMR